MSLPAWLVVSLGALTLATTMGCTGIRQWAHQGYKVGPEYCRPPAPLADQWIDYANEDVETSASVSGQWWSVFGDPALDDLIRRASQQNLTLRTAGTRIQAARASLAIAYGNLFPQSQQAYGDYARINLSRTNAFVPPATDFDFWTTGFSAAWELDFWGRFRRSIELQDALLDASIADYDNVLVVLQAEVAVAYIQYRTLQERLDLARRNVALQRRTFEIADVKFRNELVSELDVAQAGENLAFTESAIPALESGIRQLGNAICILLGEPPRDLSAELGQAPIPEAPEQILVGIPAELLRRRPDVRRAERLAAAQSAAIGIAEADFYPQIAITGFLGVESEKLSDLFRSQSFTGSIGPGFRWNILNYGRIANNVRLNEAQFRQRVLEYQDTVLAASREVEDGIVSFLQERERVEPLNGSASQAQRAVDISSLQYREGKITFQPVVYMQQVLADRQDQLAASRGSVAVNLVSVYRALGGGWRTRLMPPGPLVLSADMIIDVDPDDVLPVPMAEDAVEMNEVMVNDLVNPLPQP